MTPPTEEIECDDPIKYYHHLLCTSLSSTQCILSARIQVNRLSPERMKFMPLGRGLERESANMPNLSWIWSELVVDVPPRFHQHNFDNFAMTRFFDVLSA
jgi:hypothetical protein